MRKLILLGICISFLLGIQDVIDVFDSDGEFYNNDKFYNRLKGMK